METHPIVWLGIATFAIVLLVVGWSYLSVHRRQKHGNKTEGIGGPNDPMA